MNVVWADVELVDGPYAGHRTGLPLGWIDKLPPEQLHLPAVPPPWTPAANPPPAQEPMLKYVRTNTIIATTDQNGRPWNLWEYRFDPAGSAAAECGP